MINLKSVIVFLFNLLLLLSLQAQTESMQSFSVAVGPSYIARQDLIFSPFIHRDLSPINLALQYQKDKKVHQFVQLSYTTFQPERKTPYEFIYDGKVETAYPHYFTLVQLGYGQGRHLGPTGASDAMLGGAVRLDVQALDYQYGRSSFFGYYATLGLNAWYQHTLIKGIRHQLNGRIEIPLVSWLARSPYLINDDPYIENTFSHNGVSTFFAFLGDGHLATWDQLQRADLGLHYQYKLGTRFSLGADWQLRFIHAHKPADLIYWQHDIRIRMGVQL